MEAPVAERRAEEGLITELDKLAERVDRAVEAIAALRAERDQLRQTADRLRGEQNRLLQEAGVETYGELLATLSRVGKLEEDVTALQAEREEVSQRLAAIIEKVDLVERDF